MNFQSEVLSSDIPVIVDFYADWCMPCKMIAPFLEEIEKELSGRVKVVKIDVDKDYVVASKYKVLSVPTLIIFKDGEIADQITGAVPKQIIMDKLAAVL